MCVSANCAHVADSLRHFASMSGRTRGGAQGSRSSGDSSPTLGASVLAFPTMPHADKDMPASRAATDASLRAERARTDVEWAKSQSSSEAAADAVVQSARAQADAWLTSARHREDTDPAMTIGTLARLEERTRENALIAGDRRAEDAVRRAKSVRLQVALASLLVRERQETDSRLLIERMRADESLAKRDEFLSWVSHDMRSLLGTIAMNAEILEHFVATESPNITRFLAPIQRVTAQLARLVADLLEVASFDAGKLVLNRERHDAGQLVREVAGFFKATSSAQKVVMSTDIPSEPTIAEFDRDRIAQVLTNLIANALKFTPEGGRISVGVARCGADLRLSVADSGPGISPEKLETIFERYTQLERSERKGGLGLGLHIAQRLVEAHGGRIWVESTLGQGSIFFFSVPCSPSASSET